jgi:hypothetical protein
MAELNANAKVKNSVITSNTISTNTKKPLLANITTFMKKGSDVVKDKVSKVKKIFFIKTYFFLNSLIFLSFPIYRLAHCSRKK